MKKLFTVLLAVMVCLTLASCGKPVDKEPDTHESDTETSAPSADKSQINGEMFTSSEIKEPDIAVPYVFSECERYLTLPDYDRTEKNGNSENYYKDEVLLASKNYSDENKIMTIVIYDVDGESTKIEATFEYETELSYSLNYYENGELSERMKFSYDSDERIVTFFYNKAGDPMVIEGYEFNKDGSVKSYYDTDSVSSALLSSLMSALTGGNNG